MKIKTDTIRPGVGIPLLNNDEKKLSSDTLNSIEQASEKLQDFNSPAQVAEAQDNYKAEYHNEDIPVYIEEEQEELDVEYKDSMEEKNNNLLYVEFLDGTSNIYHSATRMTADLGDGFLHLYNEDKQIAFYHSRNVVKAYFLKETIN